MAKQKSLEDLRNELSAKEAELEKAKKKLEQVEYKMNRLQNKIKTEFVQFIDGLAALPTVKEYAANFSYHPIEEVEG